MDPLKTVASFEPAKKAFSLVDEFKSFALKGNVVDLAIGVIIGTAFGKIVTSLVANLIMPLISVIMPSDNTYKDWKWTIADKPVNYGLFLEDIVNFLIVAVVLFLFFAKFLGWVMRTKTEEPAAVLTKDQELLSEIRDLLKASKPEAPPAGGGGG